MQQVQFYGCAPRICSTYYYCCIARTAPRTQWLIVSEETTTPISFWCDVAARTQQCSAHIFNTKACILIAINFNSPIKVHCILFCAYAFSLNISLSNCYVFNINHLHLHICGVCMHWCFFYFFKQNRFTMQIVYFIIISSVKFINFVM